MCSWPTILLRSFAPPPPPPSSGLLFGRWPMAGRRRRRVVCGVSGGGISEFSSPEQRTRSYALQRMALNLGFSFGPAIGGLLVGVGFFWIFVADAITTLLCAVLLALFFGWSKTRPEADASDSSEVAETANVAPAVPKSPARDMEFIAFLKFFDIGNT